MSKRESDANFGGPEIPGAVRLLRRQGYIEVNQIFNLAISNSDRYDRYDLIHPTTGERLLWTPSSEDPYVEQSESRLETIVNELLDPERMKAVPALDRRDNEGAFYRISPSSVSLISILNTSPFIPEYMERLGQRASEFLGKVAVLDKNRFGLDLEDIAIDHNGGDGDDIIFSVVPPLKPADDSTYRTDPEQYARKCKQEIEKYKRRLSR